MIEVVLHKSRRKVEKSKEVRRRSERQNRKERKVYQISRGWKTLARVGTVAVHGVSSPNITNCMTGVSVEGLAVVEGIIMITNDRKLKNMKSMTACVGDDEPVVLEMVDSDTCSHNTWCAQIETEEECNIACHQVTGKDQVCYAIYS